MDGETRLSDRQKRRAASMAREKGLTCPDCGSSDPVPGDEALARRPDGGVDMDCQSCESTSEMPLILSPEEVKALGLHPLGDRPKTP